MDTLKDFFQNETVVKYLKALRTVVKTFVASFLGFVIASGIGVLDMSAGDWKAAAGAGIAAAILVVYNSLNPNYTDYGIGSVTE